MDERENLGYPAQEVNLLVKTETDLPIKSEFKEDLFQTKIEFQIKSEFNEGLQCYKLERSDLPSLPFPPIKEELHES
ncbi:unnamed protein product, partial [Timema podura]|nr:unnamed protein product [Timema podura]